jgi:parallel beta-helix repeat protein
MASARRRTAARTARRQSHLRLTHVIGAWLALAIVFAAGLPAVAAPARDRTVIEVFPGRHALQRAVAHAHSGDVLNIHAGTYKGSVEISRPNLTLQAAGDGKVIVDAKCRANDTIFVTANGVTISGLTVQGADEGFGDFPAEIALWNVDQSGLIEFTETVNTCDAEYGIQVFQSGSIQIRNNYAHGFSDSGIYIGAITDTPNGPLVVVKNLAQDSHQGIIVEDSNGGSIQVLGNVVDQNSDAGIFLRNSDHVLIKSNPLHDNGRAGIDLDPASDHNRIIGNTALGHLFDLENEGGVGNCFKRNDYETSDGDISC